MELHPLTAEDTQVLTEKLLAGRLIPAAQAAIYTCTFGHPFYVTALTERLHDLGVDPDTISADQVAQAFLIETLSARGQIYGYCRYLYEISLQKARGYGALKGILQILAEEESLSLTEIASRLHRRPPAAQAYLRWLLEVDLLAEHEKRYAYRDPVLRFWVAQTTRGVEMDGFPRREDLDRLVSDLAERFQRTAAQLGRAKESELRELLRRLAGKSGPGVYLGRSDTVAVPAFERVENLRSEDGQIELDALAEAADGARWAVELKWRQKRAGEREMRDLLHAATTLHAQPWCISQLGFTSEAQSFAAANAMFTSTAVDLEALHRLANKLW